MCLTTVADDAPTARFVDLKAFSSEGFIFCTHLHSPKATHLGANPHTALAFWWDHVGYQVRVVGRAARITDAEADVHFAARSRDAQIASWCNAPGRPIADSASAAALARDVKQRFKGVDVPRPRFWGGFLVIPSSMEFLRFRRDRRHERLLFERASEGSQ